MYWGIVSYPFQYELWEAAAPPLMCYDSEDMKERALSSSGLEIIGNETLPRAINILNDTT